MSCTQEQPRFCGVRAEGRLAPELCQISSLTSIMLGNHSLSGEAALCLLYNVVSVSAAARVIQPPAGLCGQYRASASASCLVGRRPVALAVQHLWSASLYGFCSFRSLEMPSCLPHLPPAGPLPEEWGNLGACKHLSNL